MDSCRGSVDGQRALLASLKLDLAQNTSAIKAAKQAARKLEREAATGGLRPAAWRAVLSVYIWSNFNFHIATALAQRLARKKQGGQVGFVLPREVWQQRLHESVTEAAIKEVISAEKGMWKRAEIAAKQFMAELDTVKWLAKQNACHGVAPQAAGVYAHYTSLLVGRGRGKQNIGWSVPPCLGSKISTALEDRETAAQANTLGQPRRNRKKGQTNVHPNGSIFGFRPCRLMEKVLCLLGPQF